MLIKDEILILSDGRPGTASQAIGLAREIGFEYKIIELEFSIFAKLPNIFLSSSLFRLTKKSRDELQNLNYSPRLVISAGRRCAPIALHLKNLSNAQLKVAQIMHPNLCFKNFTWVILPKHDKISENKFPNLITTIGALTKINQQDIAKEQKKFSNWFENISKKKIALFIGGSSKKTKFEKNSAINLIKLVAKIADNMNASLLVLTSRRTDVEVIESIKSNLHGDFRFYNWEEIKNENPYLAIIGYADFFVVTGDSVSMISECCSTGKPVYIFDEKNISSKKHHLFHKNLFSENYAKKLNKNLEILENFTPEILHETKRVADIIRGNFS